MSKRKINWKTIGQQFDAASVVNNKISQQSPVTGQEYISAGQFGQNEFETRNNKNTEEQVKSVLKQALAKAFLNKKPANKNGQNKAGARVAQNAANPVLEDEFMLSRTKLDISGLIKDDAILSKKKKASVSSNKKSTSSRRQNNKSLSSSRQPNRSPEPTHQLDFKDSASAHQQLEFKEAESRAEESQGKAEIATSEQNVSILQDAMSRYSMYNNQVPAHNDKSSSISSDLRINKMRSSNLQLNKELKVEVPQVQDEHHIYNQEEMVNVQVERQSKASQLSSHSKSMQKKDVTSSLGHEQNTDLLNIAKRLRKSASSNMDAQGNEELLARKVTPRPQKHERKRSKSRQSGVSVDPQSGAQALNSGKRQRQSSQDALKVDMTVKSQPQIGDSVASNEPIRMRNIQPPQRLKHLHKRSQSRRSQSSLSELADKVFVKSRGNKKGNGPLAIYPGQAQQSTSRHIHVPSVEIVRDSEPAQEEQEQELVITSTFLASGQAQPKAQSSIDIIPKETPSKSGYVSPRFRDSSQPSKQPSETRQPEFMVTNKTPQEEGVSASQISSLLVSASQSRNEFNVAQQQPLTVDVIKPKHKQKPVRGRAYLKMPSFYNRVKQQQSATDATEEAGPQTNKHLYFNNSAKQLDQYQELLNQKQYFQKEADRQQSNLERREYERTRNVAERYQTENSSQDMADRYHEGSSERQVALKRGTVLSNYPSRQTPAISSDGPEGPNWSMDTRNANLSVKAYSKLVGSQSARRMPQTRVKQFEAGEVLPLIKHNKRVPEHIEKLKYLQQDSVLTGRSLKPSPKMTTKSAPRRYEVANQEQQPRASSLPHNLTSNQDQEPKKSEQTTNKVLNKLYDLAMPEQEQQAQSVRQLARVSTPTFQMKVATVEPDQEEQGGLPAINQRSAEEKGKLLVIKSQKLWLLDKARKTIKMDVSLEQGENPKLRDPYSPTKLNNSVETESAQSNDITLKGTASSLQQMNTALSPGSRSSSLPGTFLRAKLPDSLSDLNFKMKKQPSVLVKGRKQQSPYRKRKFAVEQYRSAVQLKTSQQFKSQPKRPLAVEKEQAYVSLTIIDQLEEPEKMRQSSEETTLQVKAKLRKQINQIKKGTVFHSQNPGTGSLKSTGEIIESSINKGLVGQGVRSSQNGSVLPQATRI